MNSSTSVLFFLFFFSFLSISQPTRACFSSIISLGGSPSDNGNLLRYLKRAIDYDLYVGFLPNGETFFGYPTGRFCNGRILNDFIAEELGLPYPPPHLAGPEDHNFKYGVNLGIAGSTLAETSFFEERGTATPFSFSIHTEIQWFKELLPIYCSSTSDCGEKLSNALFIVGPFGRNDLRTENVHNSTDDDIKTNVVPVMVDAFISGLKELVVDIGARTLLIPNSYPIGCLPASIVEFPRNDFDEETGCMNWLNDITSLFHRQFEAKLQVFRSEHPDVTILYSDLYGMTIDMIRSPKKYGIEGNPLVTCCGGGGAYNYNPTARCGEKGAKKACDDPSKALFWDGVHLTETAYKFMATELMKDLFALPSIKEQCKDIRRMNDEPLFM